MKKVCIVGDNPKTRQLAAEEPSDTEVWASSHAYRLLPRIDRWFEMHDASTGLRVPEDSYAQWLKTTTVPVYMAIPEWYIHSVRRYPLTEIIAEFGINPTSSPAYMMALAIYEAVDAIKIVGVDLENEESDYAWQWPCLRFYLGVARAKGIHAHAVC